MLGEQLPVVAATARLFWGTSPGQVFIACAAQIRGAFFLQGWFNTALDRRDDRVVDLLAQRTFDMAWEAATIDNLHVVIKVALVMELLGMAHRGTPPSNQVVQYPGFTGCPEFFQFREIIRTLPRNLSCQAGFEFFDHTRCHTDASHSPYIL